MTYQSQVCHEGIKFISTLIFTRLAALLQVLCYSCPCFNSLAQKKTPTVKLNLFTQSLGFTHI